LNQQIDLISNRPDELNKILGTRPDLDWAKILEDIRVNTPGDVRITELSASNKGQILLKGQALTYQDARDFEDNLNKLVYFDSASLYETKKEGDAEAFVLYEIDCLLKMDKGNT
jgi:Tfp pilus assembly protein PilN